MGKLFRLPQEIEVWYILPKLRKELARELVGEYKLSYERVGNLLGITKAAVSQYLKDKRANKIKLSSKLEKEVKLSAKRIYENKSNALVEIQELLKKMKKSKCACDVCRKYNKEVLEYCNCNPLY